MELDRAAEAMVEESDESTVGQWRQARDAWADQQSLLREVEHHIQALRQLDSWMEAVPLLSDQESIRHIAAEGNCLGTMEWQAGTPTGKPQGQMLNQACTLLLQLLAAQIVWALDHAHLLEMTYQMAVTDCLTGLFNRRHFDQRLAEESLRAARYGHPLSLIMLDVDHFKFYNDQYGHPEGDRILIQLARVVKRSVRRTDTVARYGGDEFAILLPETDAEGARVVAEKVRRAVEELVLWRPTCQPAWPQDRYKGQASAGSESPYYQVTISAGVVTCRLGRSSAAELLASVDRALYQAKSKGRDCVWGPEVLSGDSACLMHQSVGGAR